MIIDVLNGMLNACSALFEYPLFSLLVVSFTIFYLVIALISFIRY